MGRSNGKLPKRRNCKRIPLFMWVLWIINAMNRNNPILTDGFLVHSSAEFVLLFHRNLLIDTLMWL